MIKQILDFIKAYIRGDDAHLDFELEFAWWEVIFIIGIIGWIIYLICR